MRKHVGPVPMSNIKIFICFKVYEAREGGGGEKYRGKEGQPAHRRIGVGQSYTFKYLY